MPPRACYVGTGQAPSVHVQEDVAMASLILRESAKVVTASWGAQRRSLEATLYTALSPLLGGRVSLVTCHCQIPPQHDSPNCAQFLLGSPSTTNPYMAAGRS